MHRLRGCGLGSRALPCVLLFAILVGGCQHQGLVGFAPGAKYLLSWREDQASMPVFWCGYTGWHFYDVDLWRHNYVGVSSVEQPNDIRWLELADFYPKYGDAKYAFSPDGRRVLIDERYILNLETRRLEDIPKPKTEMKPVAWLSADELVCAAHPKGGNLRLFRLKLGQSEAMEIICGTPESNFGGQVDDLRIAPNGRYAVVHREKEDAIRLLDLVAGTVSPAPLPDGGGRRSRIMTAAWNRDCSKVVVAVETSDGDVDTKHVFLLLDTASHKTLDAHVEKHHGLYPRSGGIEWAGDQEHITGLWDNVHEYVVRPTPWRTFVFAPSEGFSYRAMPLAGWMVGDVSEGHSLLTYPLGISNTHKVAASYDGGTVAPVSEEAEVCFSEDGKLLAEMNDWGSINIRPLALPTAPPFPLPTTMPTSASGD